MFILFGTYWFTFKTYTPEQLGIRTDPGSDFTVEHRLRIFHIFWIPFFPIERVYAMRMNDKLYDLPLHYRERVHALGPQRTPWYSFMGLFLLLLAGLAYDRNPLGRWQREREDYKARMNALDGQIRGLAPQNYIVLNTPRGREAKLWYLKFLSRHDSQLTLAKMPEKKYGITTHDEIQQYFYQHRDHLDTLILSADDLISARLDHPLDLVHDGERYFVQSVDFIRGPAISGQWESGDNYLKIILHNYGDPVTMTSLESQRNTMNWITKLPQKSKPNADGVPSFEIEASGFGRVRYHEINVYFEDSSGNIYKYYLEGDPDDKMIVHPPGSVY